jgi:unsaturated rhamnogalacturonyl hydrolase
MKKNIVLIFTLLVSSTGLYAQRNVTNANDSNTPLHLLRPDYPINYGIPKTEEIKSSLDKIHTYLNEVTLLSLLILRQEKPLPIYQNWMKIQL